MNYKLITNLSKEKFDQFVSKSEHKSVYQTSAWCEVKNNWDCHYVGIEGDGVLVAAYLIMFRKLIGPFKMGYVPRGPILDYNNTELLDFTISSLIFVGKEHGTIFVKIDPNVKIGKLELKDKDKAANLRNDPLVYNFTKRGALFSGYEMDIYKTTQPRVQLNYHVFDAFDARIPKDTIKKIKRAETCGVTVVESGIKDISKFMETIHNTEQRKGISLRDEKYFVRMLEAFKDNSTLLLAYIDFDKAKKLCKEEKEHLTAELESIPSYQNKKRAATQSKLEKINHRYIELIADEENYKESMPVGGVLLVSDGVTTELLYSGFNEKYKRYFPAYMLRYKGIEWAKNRGCKWFNFGGVQGTFDDGLYEFKSQFNPMIDVYIGEFDIPCRPFLYKIFKRAVPAGKRILKRLRRLKRKAIQR